MAIGFVRIDIVLGVTRIAFDAAATRSLGSAPTNAAVLGWTVPYLAGGVLSVVGVGVLPYSFQRARATAVLRATS